MSSESDRAGHDRKGLDRRTFLSTGGAAAGLAAVAMASPAIAKPEPKGQLVEPTGDVQQEPVMAYVHNAERDEVTVVSGTTERTYRDPGLARRLRDAAAHRQS